MNRGTKRLVCPTRNFMPLDCTSCTTRLACSSETTIGLVQMICLPAVAAASICSMCKWSGE